MASPSHQSAPECQICHPPGSGGPANPLYHCSICGKGFSRKGNRDRHVETFRDRPTHTPNDTDRTQAGSQHDPFQQQIENHQESSLAGPSNAFNSWHQSRLPENFVTPYMSPTDQALDNVNVGDILANSSQELEGLQGPVTIYASTDGHLQPFSGYQDDASAQTTSLLSSNAGPQEPLSRHGPDVLTAPVAVNPPSLNQGVPAPFIAADSTAGSARHLFEYLYSDCGELHYR